MMQMNQKFVSDRAGSLPLSIIAFSFVNSAVTKSDMEKVHIGKTTRIRFSSLVMHFVDELYQAGVVIIFDSSRTGDVG